MTDALLVVLLLGLANGTIAQIVTYSSLFEPLRDAAEDWESGAGGYFTEWITCPLCFGMWSAAIISALATWRLTDAGAVDTALLWAAGAFAIHGVGLITGYAYRVLLAAVDRLEA